MTLEEIAKEAAARGETDISWALLRIANIEPETENFAAVMQNDDGPLYEKEYQEYSERYKERIEGKEEEAYVEIRDQEEERKKKIKKEGPPVQPESIQGKDS